VRGIPKVFNTKADYLNTHSTVKADGTTDQKKELVSAFNNLKQSSKVLLLKDGVTKPSEEQTVEDFELVLDEGSAMVTIGFTVAEIDLLISELEA